MTKKFIITNVEKINSTDASKVIVTGSKNMQVSDSFHTMDELYEHRFTLYVALCKSFAIANTNKVWRAKIHSDGNNIEKWFILGINKEKGRQISYHLPLSKWDDCEFAETLKKAPEFDGHTPADVLKRIANL